MVNPVSEPTAVVASPRAPGGVGRATCDDAVAVGRDAVREALGGRAPAEADLVLIFPSASYDLDALHLAATEAAAPARVVGATSCGAFTGEHQVERGCVAIHLVAGERTFGVAHLDRIDADLAGTGRRVAEMARDRAGDERDDAVLLLLADGATPDQRELARGTHEVTSALVPLVGAAAGDDLRWEATWTFGEGRCSDRGVVGVWINAERPMAVAHDRGWRPKGRPMLVTRAEGPVIHELDGRAALDAYLEQSEVVLQDDVSLNMACLAHPIGLPNARGDYDVRQLHASTPDRSLVITTSIPEQTVLHVMQSDPDRLLDAARAAAREAADELGRDAEMAIVFSCCTRPPLMDGRIAEEVEILREELGDVPIGGFFTCGEFARTTGATGNHNSTVALLVL